VTVLPLLAVLLGVLLGAALAGRRGQLQALGRRPLQVAIALLGLSLTFTDLAQIGGRHLAVVVLTVVVTYVGTQALARQLGFSRAQGLLVASGFSVCGASAVAAMEPVADADEGDSGLAVALVTLCGSLAIVVLPALRGPLGLDEAAFGAWAGASVHDVGQVVATAGSVGTVALTTALVVKLSRVVLIVPLVLWEGRRCATAGRARVPWFVPGFLVAAGVHSLAVLPAPVQSALATGQHALLLVGLVGLGAGVRLDRLRRLGGRATVLGLSSWLLVAGTAYLLLQLVD
jgi:uncharacterized integral membrane protein (TIGR00698 family)